MYMNVSTFICGHCCILFTNALLITFNCVLKNINLQFCSLLFYSFVTNIMLTSEWVRDCAVLSYPHSSRLLLCCLWVWACFCLTLAYGNPKDLCMRSICKKHWTCAFVWTLMPLLSVQPLLLALQVLSLLQFLILMLVIYSWSKEKSSDKILNTGPVHTFQFIGKHFILVTCCSF